jgi:hypothetical protein
MIALPVGTVSKMKVHPGILMKTKKSRFQVSGAGRQSPASQGCSPVGVRCVFGFANNAEMKVHPGILMKTKKGRFQMSAAAVSGAKAHVPGVPPSSPAA